MAGLLRSTVDGYEAISARQRAGCAIAAFLYIGAGAMHFVRPGLYLKIMPPYIPWHLAMVRLSGVCEIAGGFGLLVPGTRRAAGWGLVLLLIAVFPANLYMATNPAEAGATAIPSVLRWGRLPLQLLLMVWLLWCTRPRSGFRRV